MERVISELELHILHVEQLGILLYQGVLGLDEDLDERRFVEIEQGCNHRQSADEFWNQPELQQVFGFAMLEHLAGFPLVRSGDVSAKAHRLALHAVRDDLLETRKGAAANEQDVRGVDLEEFLLRVFAATLRRNARGSPFHQLQQRLLNALARHVARDRRIVRLAADLVDLVDVDDPALRLLDIAIRSLEQLQADVFDVLADVAGLRQGRRIGHCKRHVEDPGKGLRQKRLAAAGRSDQQDVRFGELDVVSGFRPMREALVVVVDGDGEHALRAVLTDHIIVENLADLGWGRNSVTCLDERGLGFFANDIVAKLDALIADEDGWAGNQLPDLVLRLAAERAVKGAFAVAA